MLRDRYGSAPYFWAIIEQIAVEMDAELGQIGSLGRAPELVAGLEQLREDQQVRLHSVDPVQGSIQILLLPTENRISLDVADLQGAGHRSALAQSEQRFSQGRRHRDDPLRRRRNRYWTRIFYTAPQ